MSDKLFRLIFQLIARAHPAAFDLVQLAQIVHDVRDRVFDVFKVNQHSLTSDILPDNSRMCNGVRESVLQGGHCAEQLARDFIALFVGHSSPST